MLTARASLKKRWMLPLVVGELGVQDLDRRAAPDLLVHRLVDRAHAALAELAHDAVVPNALFLASCSSPDWPVGPGWGNRGERGKPSRYGRFSDGLSH